MSEPEFLDFLRELSEACGPSGFARDAARLVKLYVELVCDHIETDKLGSLLFSHQEAADGPVVLVPGHMVEVGLIV